MTTLVTLIADAHCGNSFGPLPPRYILPDGQEIKPSALQAELQKHWLDTVDIVKHPSREFPGIADDDDLAKVTISVGDLIEGLHHQNVDLVSPRLDVHEDIAIKWIEPLAEASDVLIFIGGTPTHVGPGAASEARIARNFDNSVPDGSSPVWWHFRHSIDGVRFDVAHHSRGTRVEWTRTTPVRTAELQAEIKYAREGLHPPHLLFRAHNHKIADTGLSYPIRAMTLPAWCWLAHYVSSKAAPEALVAEIGAVFVLCDKGQYTLKLKKYELKGRMKRWKELKLPKKN